MPSHSHDESRHRRRPRFPGVRSCGPVVLDVADPPSAAAARVVAALARWQAETGERRHPNLVVTEVLDRVASGHAYLSVVFAHESDWFGRDVKPIADLFLRWLMERHPELGGPHLAFLAAHRDLVADETAEPADLGPFADLRRHATEFAVDWLARIWLADYCK